MHKMRFFFTVVTTLVPSLSECACLTYSSRIYVTGNLERAVAPGPPSYESIARGDKPEIYWVIRFERPICVDPDPTDKENPGIAGIREIQLVLSREEYLAYERSLGKQVRLSGTLFPAHTGHHHTPVLMANVKRGD
jgi:uncharacterized protein DUF4431